MRARILQGRQVREEQILDYCLSDIEALAALLLKLLPVIDLDTAIHWGELALCLRRWSTAAFRSTWKYFSIAGQVGLVIRARRDRAPD